MTRPPGPSWGRPSPPLGCWAQGDPRETQACLRRLFRRWGRPEGLRVVNGAPWGSRGDLPTDLVCWLAGLGVAVTADPPRLPQANGVVGRSQGVGKRGSEPSACGDAAESRRRLDVVDRWQREPDPSVRGRPRLEAYPELAHSGRPYDPASEPRSWELPRVWELMGAHRVPRPVARPGKLSVDSRPYSLGVAWAGQQVWVGFDPVAGAWPFQDSRGHEIRRQVAEELTVSEVMSMGVTNRRGGAHAARPPVQNPEAQPTSRSHVIYRKLSGGTASESGSRFVERMLSVVATCRRQDIKVLDYLTRCYQASLDGQPAPSLLPAASSTRVA